VSGRKRGLEKVDNRSEHAEGKEDGKGSLSEGENGRSRGMGLEGREEGIEQGGELVEDEMRKRVRSAMRTRAETSRKGTKGVQPVEYCRGKGNDGE
jgi:hypothetical protein